MSTESLVRKPFTGQTPYQKLSEEDWPDPDSPPKKWKFFKTPILLSISGAILALTLLYCAYIISGPQVNPDLPTHRPRIGVSYESDHSATRTSPLPPSAALTASRFNYTILIDDSNWNYGRLTDYFDIAPLSCQPPHDWKEMPRSAFSLSGLNQSDHVYASRYERDGYKSFILENVDKRAIDTHSVWNYLNHRDRKVVLPATQNLHYSLQSLFDMKSAALRDIWRPNKMILDEILKMKKDFNDKMLQSLPTTGHARPKVFSPNSLDLESPLPKKLISVHFRLGDKKYEVESSRPAASNGVMSAYANPKPYLDLVRSFVPDWKTSKNLPMLFVFSDDAKEAIRHFDEEQLLYYPNQRFPLLSPPESKMITDHGWNQAEFNTAPLAVRQKLGSALIRDVTFAVDHSEAIICSSSSNICNLMFHLRGSQEAIGPNPSVRSVDVRWYPTAFCLEMTNLSLDPVKDRDQILAMAPQLAANEKNYIEL
ncbi:hypothetical protein CROQUDRAFT_110344 [Cronartium quercuum f. sp. fusiforme G11]|uniref:Uncharacterized protein n=1 Tax=Cronartium quercuum f. sp. fusiforme G11 TaxID=708437 RepID=A0A9P6N879_9BASI|nr:hypothetical protein CROQUDRAFT_110344 [Cronartium quercuum f. sp. fusiforme G11]